MADNYLERRMEELHAPRRQTTFNAAQKRTIPWSLPPLRVVVINGCTRTGRETVRQFAEARMRVTAIDPCRETGREMASRLGIRYMEADTSSADALSQAIEVTMKEWRDVDMVIFIDSHDTGNHLLQAVAKVIGDRRHRYPRVSSYVPRILYVGCGDMSCDVSETEGNVVQRIAAKEDTAAETIGRLCLFLAIPDNSDLHKISL